MITLLRYTYAPSGHDEAPVYYNFGNISLTNNISEIYLNGNISILRSK